MAKMTNIYSYDQAISLAMKIERLQNYGVPFEVGIARGIGGERVVSLSWDDKILEEAIENDEEF